MTEKKDIREVNIKAIKKELSEFIADQQEKYQGLTALMKTAYKHKDNTMAAIYAFRCDDVLCPLSKMKDILNRL